MVSKQPLCVGKIPVTSRAHQQMHAFGASGELLVDVALEVGDHGDARRSRQNAGSFLGGKQPAKGILVFNRRGLGSFTLGPVRLRICAPTSRIMPPIAASTAMVGCKNNPR